MVHRPVKTIVFFTPAAAASREARWEPDADIYRSRRGWLVKLDLAGVRRNDVTLEAAGRRLAVRGRRRDLVVSEDWSHYSMEIAYSDFERIIEMPCNLDCAAVNAELLDGMLLIYVTPEGEGR
ncbi:MAG TPA: Hsp20/alpha crystallin family protein [Blastocatellia bacterium]